MFSRPVQQGSFFSPYRADSGGWHTESIRDNVACASRLSEFRFVEFLRHSTHIVDPVYRGGNCGVTEHVLSFVGSVLRFLDDLQGDILRPPVEAVQRYSPYFGFL